MRIIVFKIIVFNYIIIIRIFFFIRIKWFVQTILKEKYNIDTGTVYYPPVHLQPYYKENYGYKEGDLPKSEKNLIREICLPIFVDITDKQLNYVIESVKAELS